MREQHTQVAIPLLGDAPQVAAIARAVLLGCQAKPVEKMPCILEVADITGWPPTFDGMKFTCIRLAFLLT
jgi:hypothetical protein